MKNIFVLIFFFLTLSCLENSLDDDTTTSSNEEIIINEKGDSLLVAYWENGNKKQQTTLKNGSKNGVEKNFNQKGGLQSSGKVINGKKTGIWKFFDENGYLKHIYEFKVIKSKSEINRDWKIGKDGDTIVDESHFYETSFIYDTISFGEFNALNIRLTRPYFGDQVGLLLGDFNEDFSNINDITVDSVLMTENHEFQYYFFSYGEGDVPVRLIIVDMELDENGSKKGQMIKMYVEETFFVK